MNFISYRLHTDPQGLIRVEIVSDHEAAWGREEWLKAAGARSVRNTYRGPCSQCGKPVRDRDGADVCPRCHRQQVADLAYAEIALP